MKYSAVALVLSASLAIAQSPTTNPAWTAESDQAYAHFATSVASAGDVNKDGYADVIVGAPEFDNGQTNEGKVSVYYGSATGFSSTPSWTAEGDQEKAAFGACVASAGDVNKDGYADVIIGAPLYDNDETNEGRVFVYYGGPTGLSSTPSWITEGNQAEDFFGVAVASAGDVNKDGYADVVIGAALFDNGQTNEGRVFVYYGSPTGLPSAPSWTAEGDQDKAHFGMAAASAGDVNKDGYADVIVGAYHYDNGETDEGKAFLYYGGPTGLSSTPSWNAEGNQNKVSFGVSVASAGDVNKDGYADVLIGTWDPGAGLLFPDGKVFAYYGSSAGLPSTPSWTMTANQTDALFGHSVASAGDVNKDGYTDVIVGACTLSNDQEREGRVYVFHGTPAGLSTTAAWTAEADKIESLFGWSVASAGDVNKDGFSDILVGAPKLNNGQSEEGQAFVYYGSSTGIAGPGPKIALSASTLSFTATVGETNPASQTATIANSGSGSLSWTATKDVAWLILFPESGQAAAGASNNLQVNTTTIGLSAGTYTGTITVSAPGASNTPQKITVTLSLTNPESAPQIGLSPDTLSFTGAVNGTDPSPKTVTLSNTGTGTLNWTANPNAAWLSVSPPSGQGPANLKVILSTSGLPAGTHTGTITVSATGASPKTIKVTLTLSDPTAVASDTRASKEENKPPKKKSKSGTCSAGTENHNSYPTIWIGLMTLLIALTGLPSHPQRRTLL